MNITAMTKKPIKNTKLQDLIVVATASHFAIDPVFFTTNRNRSDNSSYQRQICFYLIKQKTFLSNDEIGKLFNLGECAVRHGINRVFNDLDVKDKRTITNIRLIEIIINNFNQKKISEIKNTI